MTPFERNLDIWRQLWRVVERSELVVQIGEAWCVAGGESEVVLTQCCFVFVQWTRATRCCSAAPI